MVMVIEESFEIGNRSVGYPQTVNEGCLEVEYCGTLIVCGLFYLGLSMSSFCFEDDSQCRNKTGWRFRMQVQLIVVYSTPGCSVDSLQWYLLELSYGALLFHMIRRELLCQDYLRFEFTTKWTQFIIQAFSCSLICLDDIDDLPHPRWAY